MSSQKKSSRLEGKDLITIGIYTVIYVVIVMLVAMLGFIPIFIPLMAVLCPLIGGIPYMLYVTKAKKFGMTAIMGFLIGLVMVFFGNGYLTMVTGLKKGCPQVIKRLIPVGNMRIWFAVCVRWHQKIGRAHV